MVTNQWQNANVMSAYLDCLIPIIVPRGDYHRRLLRLTAAEAGWWIPDPQVFWLASARKWDYGLGQCKRGTGMQEWTTTTDWYVKIMWAIGIPPPQKGMYAISPSSCHLTFFMSIHLTRFKDHHMATLICNTMMHSLVQVVQLPL
jgi:hypothetical protein